MSDTNQARKNSTPRGRSLPSTFIEESHEAYEGARRVWNGMVDRRPSLIARCSSAEEVRRRCTIRAIRRAPGKRPRRWAQRRWECGLRRRRDDRPLTDEADRGRP